MGIVRDEYGNVIRGTGAALTPLQEKFIREVKKQGLSRASKVAKEIGYSNYYRDRNTIGTAFYHKLHSVANEIEADIAVSKGMNLERLVEIRDRALENDDFKTAMEAIKIINDMAGHKAPVKVQKTKIDIKASIDLTRPVDEEDGPKYIDIDYSDEEVDGD
jgi:hypothetical protein